MKRKLLQLALLCPWVTGCSAVAKASDTTPDPQRRLKGIGLVLVVDAVPGAEMRGVVFYDDRGVSIYASSLVAKRNREIMGLGGARVPSSVRAVWRENPKPVWGKQGGIDYEGTMIGDYSMSVAERIPDEVLNDIRALEVPFEARRRLVRLGYRAPRRRHLQVRHGWRRFSRNEVLSHRSRVGQYAKV